MGKPTVYTCDHARSVTGMSHDDDMGRREGTIVPDMQHLVPITFRYLNIRPGTSRMVVGSAEALTLGHSLLGCGNGNMSTSDPFLLAKNSVPSGPNATSLGELSCSHIKDNYVCYQLAATYK